MRIGIVGDFMPSGVLNGKEITISNNLEKYLKGFDVKIATLETAVGDRPAIDYWKYKDNREVCVWSQTSNLSKIKDLGIDIVSLANNHTGDLGEEGLKFLMEQLDVLDIKFCGAGLNLKEAERPVVIEKNNKTYAFIAVCQNHKPFLGSMKFADNNSWGVLEYDSKKTIKLIESLKSKYDYVFVIAHGGLEFMWLPEDIICDYYKLMIDTGADGVIGGHPHQIQPKVNYKGKPIYYSLGNFIFPEIFVDNNSNVFYPTAEEANKLPTFNRFPVARNFSMRYYWTSMGRKSMVADFTVANSKITSTYKLLEFRNPEISIIKFDFLLKLKIFIFKIICNNINSKHNKIINRYISLYKYVYFYKVKTIYDKKYQFYKYIKTDLKK